VIVHLQEDISGKHEKEMKMHTHKTYSIRHKHKGKRAHKANPTRPKLGQTPKDTTQVQWRAHHAKAVAGRFHLGAAAPPSAPLSSSFHVALPGELPKAVAC